MTIGICIQNIDDNLFPLMYFKTITKCWLYDQTEKLDNMINKKLTWFNKLFLYSRDGNSNSLSQVEMIRTTRMPVLWEYPL